jgi:hypothetical protein
MIANAGWHYFTMPTCVAPGDYLMRVEIIALHNAGTQGWSTHSSCLSSNLSSLPPSVRTQNQNLLTHSKAAPNSTWNAHKSASPHPAPTPAPTLSASPAHTPPAIPASRSVSTTQRASRTWVVRATKSQGRRRWCAVVQILETEGVQRCRYLLQPLLRPRHSRRMVRRRVCTRSVVGRGGRGRRCVRRGRVQRVGSTIRSVCRRESDLWDAAPSSRCVDLSITLLPFLNYAEQCHHLSTFFPNSNMPRRPIPCSSHHIPLTFNPTLSANSPHCFSVLSKAPRLIICQSICASR